MRAARLARAGAVLLAAGVTGFWFFELAHRAEISYRRQRATLDGQGAEAAPPASAAEVLTLRFDRRSAAEGPTLGWSSHEAGAGVWSIGTSAALRLPPVAPGRAVDVALTLSAFVHPPQLPDQTVRVSAHGVPLATWRLAGAEPTVMHLKVPVQAREADGAIELRFELPNADAPARLSGGGDARRIAIKLIQAVVTG